MSTPILILDCRRSLSRFKFNLKGDPDKTQGLVEFHESSYCAIIREERHPGRFTQGIPMNDEPDEPKSLTDHQQEILQLAKSGKSMMEIAREIGLPLDVVANHLLILGQMGLL